MLKYLLSVHVTHFTMFCHAALPSVFLKSNSYQKWKRMQPERSTKYPWNFKVSWKKKEKKQEANILKSLPPNVIRGSAYVPELLSCTSVFFYIIYVGANLFIITFCVLLGTSTFWGRGVGGLKILVVIHILC